MKYNWKDKVILIAEDEETNYMLLQEILTDTEAQILWAHNGFEAVDLCARNSINLVLMDIKMPGMNGYEATQRIKKLNKDLPVIAQTAYAMIGEKEKIMLSGCDDYISKPIKYDQFLTVVNKHMH